MAWDDVVVRCYKCKCDFSLPRGLYDTCKRSAHVSFFCPYGHQQHFIEGESEETKLRRERDRLAQQIAYKNDQIERERRRTAAAKGQATKLRNRAKNGGEQ